MVQQIDTEMNSYITLINFTQQGLETIQEAPRRTAAFKAAAKKAGVNVTQVFKTLGEYDGVIVFEAEDDAAATGLMLSLSSLGKVRTKTMRAFNDAEFADIVATRPKI